MKRIQQLMLPLLKTIRKLGQSQLIRRHIAHCLQFGCQLEAHVLYESLDTFNCALVNDVKRHYTAPEKFPYPVKSSPLLFETVAMIESCGMDDPFHKVYATSEPLEGLPVLLFIFLLTYLPKVIKFPRYYTFA
jgi:WASH complex subunit strumpellin